MSFRIRNAHGLLRVVVAVIVGSAVFVAATVSPAALEYEFTVTDPETWTSAWTASVPLGLNPEAMFEYACHEGNYSMPVMLGGARVEEAAGQ
mgnify:CR=1 FL=1